APAFTFACFFALAMATKGFPDRFDPQIRELINSYSVQRDLSRDCALRAEDLNQFDVDFLDRHCAFADASAPNSSILLFGDSHANHCRPFMDELAKDAGRRGTFLVMGSCSILDAAKFTECERFNRMVRDLYSTHHYDYVVVAGRWKS